MSESKAERSKLVAGLTKLKIDEEDETLEIESQNGSEVKGQVAEKVEGGSEIGGNLAEIDVGDEEVEDEGEGFIQFLFEPEVPEIVLNKYVIAEISKYLGFHDLKSLRGVNKLWSTGAMSAFVQNSVFALRERSKLEAFGAETEALKGVSALRMSISYYDDRNVEEVRHIFSSLAANLTALELIHMSYEEFFLDVGAPISLPTLTSLSLRGIIHVEGREEELYAYLYAAAPALRQLYIQHLAPYALSPLLAEDGSRNWALAPNLSSLRTSFELFNLDSFMSLLNFPQNWERLELAISACNRLPQFHSLSRFLEKNKDSLVGLYLKLECPRTCGRPIDLQFPTTFSKLESLELDFGQFWGVINFGDGTLKYSEAFPSLSSLSVNLPHYGQLAAGIWAYLFTRRQVFRGLRELILEGIRFTAWHRFLRQQWIPEEGWAERMFPEAKLQIN